jgi:hypothetical protein
MPGIGPAMDGAMQQAPQPGRQSGTARIAGSRGWRIGFRRPLLTVGLGQIA